MGLKIVSPSGGSIELIPAATATAYTATLPAVTTTLMGTDSVQTVTSKTLSGATWTSPAGSVVTSGSTLTTTSGTTADFTGIPSWVKRIRVVLNQFGTNGTSPYILVLGTASSFETTGYITSTGLIFNGATTYTATGITTAVSVTQSNFANTGYNTTVLLSLQDSTTNYWSNISFTTGGTTLQVSGGGKSLAGTLTRIRLTTQNGTDAFVLGSATIQYQ